MGDTVVWISGASSGIGAALAAAVPWPDARRVNLDIRPAEGIETLIFDLAKPETWRTVDAHFRAELSAPGLALAVFLHCAYAPIGKGTIAAVDAESYATSLIANNAGILAIAAAFLRHVPPGIDAGLMVMSSGAASARLPGYSGYGSAKAGVEQWVRVARAEMRRRGWGPWVVAMRPGLVRTDTALAASALDSETFPLGAAMADDLARHGMGVDEASARIWALLPPAEGSPAMLDIAADPDRLSAPR